MTMLYIDVAVESGRTEQHAAVVEQVAKVLEHRSLIDTTSSTEVAQEATAGDHHVRRRVLRPTQSHTVT